MIRLWRGMVFILVLTLLWVPQVVAKEQVVLKWTTCCAQTDRHELFQAWAQRFESRNPDIKIEWEYPSGKYSTVLTTRFAGGAASDVMWIGGDFFSLYSAFMPLDDMKAKAGSVLKETMPTAFPLFSWNGRLGAAPYGVNTVTLFLSQRILGEAGLVMPNSQWTWDDFIRISKRLTRDTNGDGTIDRFAFDLRPGGYEFTAYSWGSPPFTSDMKRAAFNNPVTVAATQVFADLFSNKYGTLQAPKAAGANVEQMLAQIQKGVGMLAGGVWAVPALRSLPDDDWEAVPLPWLEYQGKRYRNSYVSGEAWAISNTTKHPAEARRFVEFLLEKEQMTEFAKLGAIIPAQSSVARVFFSPTSSRPKNMAAFLDAMETANPLMQNHPIGTDIYNALAKIRTDLFAGSISAANALQQMEQVANQMLDEYWAKH